MPARLVVPAAVLVLAASGAAQTSAPAAKHPISRPALRISGTVRGLYPGARRVLRLSVRNTRGFPVRVVSLKVRVGNASRACRRRQVRIARVRRSFVVRAHRSRRITVRVTMLRTAPDACQGAVFPLRFKARGRRA
jgi:hypothetical protein